MQPLAMLTTAAESDTPADLPCCQAQVPVLAELLCSEPLNEDRLDEFDEHSVQSYFDPVLLTHSEVMNRLKILEARMDKPHDYFCKGSKEEILPYMRKVVASWMLEVS